MSTWLIASERHLDDGNALFMRLLHLWEGLALRIADLAVLDTAEYARWFSRQHRVAASSFALVPTGADSRRFMRSEVSPRLDGTFTVIYYGSYIPNHGVPAIVGAALLLRSHDRIRFLLIGDGPERQRAEAEVARHSLHNVEFVPWLDQDALIDRVRDADLCLGAFGTTPQSLMTVQNKIYECMALGRPVLTGDSPAVRAAVRVDEELFVCARADAASLAQAIRALQDDPDRLRRVGEAGCLRFERDYTVEALGARFAAHLRELHLRHSTEQRGA